METSRKHLKITLHWVKGHSGVKGNDEADSAANKGRERSRKEEWWKRPKEIGDWDESGLVRTLKNANVGIMIDEETEVRAGKKEGGAQASKARMRGLRIDDDGREVPTLSKITGIITKAGKEYGEARSRMHGTGGFKEMETDPDFLKWKEGEREMKKQQDRAIRKEVAKWVCGWRRKAKKR